MTEFFKSKWFWISAPLLVWVFVAFTLTLVQNVHAVPVSSCGGYQHCVQAEIASIGGVIGSGNIQSYTGYRDVSHIGDVSSFTNSLTTPSLSGTPTITYTISNLIGCTQANTVTQETTVSSTYEAFFYSTQFTLTDTTCTGQLRIVLTAGLVPQEIWDQLLGFTIQSSNDLETFNKQCETSTWNSECDNTDFYNMLGSNVWEFLSLIIIFILAIFIWLRSNDYAIRFTMVILSVLTGIIWLGLYNANHHQILLATGVATLIIASYMAIRAAFDIFEEKSDKPQG